MRKYAIMNVSSLFKSTVRLLAVSSGIAYDPHSWNPSGEENSKHGTPPCVHWPAYDTHRGPNGISLPKWSTPDLGGGHGRCRSQAVKLAVAKCRSMVEHVRIEQGIPGASFAIAVDGNIICQEGLGYSDVENSVACTEDTVMRIASISKPLVAVAVLQLWQEGKIDLDCPVQAYVTNFPVKEFAGKTVQITTRQILSHLGGIRHYGTVLAKEDTKKEFEHSEYYIKKHYKSVDEALRLFAQDKLLAEPG